MFLLEHQQQAHLELALCGHTVQAVLVKTEALASVQLVVPALVTDDGLAHQGGQDSVAGGAVRGLSAFASGCRGILFSGCFVPAESGRDGRSCRGFCVVSMVILQGRLASGYRPVLSSTMAQIRSVESGLS